VRKAAAAVPGRAVIRELLGLTLRLAASLTRVCRLADADARGLRASVHVRFLSRLCLFQLTPRWMHNPIAIRMSDGGSGKQKSTRVNDPEGENESHERAGRA
jgi:hypothetical protein